MGALTARVPAFAASLQGEPVSRGADMQDTGVAHTPPLSWPGTAPSTS